QTLLFSATLDGNIGKLAQRLLKEPKRVQVADVKAKHENIVQRLHYVNDIAHKNRLLQHFLDDADLSKAIVFTSTKRHADSLARDLHAKGYAAAALHGDMNQGARNRTIKNLRSNAVRLLVATDVASRGIDVAGISHVINFDLPKSAEDYVHRIGRTGRAGASGIAISFALRSDSSNVKDIERYTGQSLTAHVIPGFEPKHETPTNPKVKHKRKFPTGGQHFSAPKKPNGNTRSADGNAKPHKPAHRPDRAGFAQKRRTSGTAPVMGSR
ncbi:MAG: DEAD/DEAH box helicase, partial [Gammaproteobacteria bacterium]